MNPLRVLIVDDEPLARRRLEILLREQPAIELAGSAADGVAATRMIAERAPDVVLLDIKMPGLTGLEVLDALGEGSGGKGLPIVIFVTAFDRFALDAFERAAFDYLLKPVEPARLAAALTRAREALAGRAAAERALELEEILRNLRGDPANAPAPSLYAREIWIQERGGRTSVPIAAIDWIAAERDYVRIHTGARSFLVRQSIGALAERLDPAQFIRIHRSSLVRTDRIVRIRHAAGRGAVILSTGVEVAVSRRHMGALKAMSRGA
ncbi:MAG TPA: LytTR family DNA-binding domain-containing protein [Phenylobacterium sp.]|jgi:DNA-binding LytR/AlgR family response regulator|uniref:LytR/AlgR family response regulator transcription factor n=1 Tax=Phenylobacterium sp. TaxID=1871053 RepID=UPI002CF27FD0|nr:LytTR family DNA-binding domain-containing protein [Phenylobacterium sp.]HXA41076.1 LytTR family DNA-binding domain-containing protein [Phenylobacterium sp.]